MAQTRKGPTITLIILITLVLQLIFIAADRRDTPHKAVMEFSTAYFKYDPAMAQRLCKDLGPGAVDQYIWQAAQEARQRGFSLSFLKYSLAHVETEIISESPTEAEIRMTAVKKQFLRSLFTGDPPEPVNEVLKVVREEGKWKVCGSPFELPEV